MRVDDSHKEDKYKTERLNKLSKEYSLQNAIELDREEIIPLRWMETPSTKMLEKRIAISKTKEMRFMIREVRYNANTLRKKVTRIRNYSKYI